MWIPTLLALLSCVISVCSESSEWEYFFVDQNLTWSEAQHFCRQHYHDLACISSAEDNLRLPRPQGTSRVWIGLHDDPRDMSPWRWSAGDTKVSYYNNEPYYLFESRQCGVLRITFLDARSCSMTYNALCYSGSNPKVFSLSSDRMTWDDALAFCRANYTDLAMIESEEEHAAAVEAANDIWFVWIGLHRRSAKWSDNRAVTYLHWYYPLADYEIVPKPFCMADFTWDDNNMWLVFPCQERRPFYCQDRSKSRRIVKMTFSGQDLANTAINQAILAEMEKMFEAAGRTDVKLKWKIGPEKQAKKKEAKDKDTTAKDCSEL